MHIQKKAIDMKKQTELRISFNTLMMTVIIQISQPILTNQLTFIIL